MLEKNHEKQNDIINGLTLSLFLSLVSFPSTTNAQQPQRFKVATGVVTPGMGQTL
jgi:hypothetical protein